MPNSKTTTAYGGSSACSSCGTAAKSEHRFCPSCGTQNRNFIGKSAAPQQTSTHVFFEDLRTSHHPALREMARRQLQELTPDGGIHKSAKSTPHDLEALAELVRQRLYDPSPARREQARRILMEAAA